MPHLRTFSSTGNFGYFFQIFFSLFFHFSALLFLLVPNLTPDCMSQKHSQHESFLGLLAGECEGLLVPSLGKLCVTEGNTRNESVRVSV